MSIALESLRMVLQFLMDVFFESFKIIFVVWVISKCCYPLELGETQDQLFHLLTFVLVVWVILKFLDNLSSLIEMDPRNGNYH